MKRTIGSSAASTTGAASAALAVEVTETALSDGKFAYHFVAKNTGKQRVDAWSLRDGAQGYGIKGLNVIETSAPPG